jgi:hypothetical protein
METVTRAQGQQLDLVARHMEGEQVQQVVVGAAGDDLEAAHAVCGLATVQRFDRAQVDDLGEQFDQLVGIGRAFQRTDQQFQSTLALGQVGSRRQRPCRQSPSRCRRSDRRPPTGAAVLPRR